MLIAGGDDLLWPSSTMALQVAARLRKDRHKFADQLLIYPGAGHDIGYPFVPTQRTIAAGTLLLGGTAAANAHADVDAWTHVLEFLKTSLGP